MSFKLIIDNRETKLIELLGERTINKFTIQIAPLKIGDIVICRDCDIESIYCEENLVQVFERKTCADLLASINDGRAREQKARLLANIPLNLITYIIENPLTSTLNKYTKNGRNIVLGAMVNKQYRDNIRVLKTSCLEETLDFVLNICKKTISNIDFFVKKQNKMVESNSTSNLHSQSNLNYTDTIKIAKKDNITCDNFGVLSLTIIPGISTKIAQEIVSHFEGYINLVLRFNNAYNLKNNNDKNDNGKNKNNQNNIVLTSLLKEISDIQIDISNGKNRRIGIKIAEKLKLFLLKSS